MTAAWAVLTYTGTNGTALGLECGCGQRHRDWPWERATVWDDEERHYCSFGDVDMDRVADLIAARGYRVTGEWSTGDVVRRVAVEPTAAPSAPGTAEAWESDDGACLGMEPFRGPEPGPAAITVRQEHGDAF